MNEPAGSIDRLSGLRFDNSASVPRGLRPQTGGPLDPNWYRLGSLGAMGNWREAQKAAYAEGPQGKLRSAINRWVQFLYEAVPYTLKLVALYVLVYSRPVWARQERSD